jgi:CheY-like chemotaxis protein
MPEKAPKPKKILVIDDDPELLKLLSAVLAHDHYQVVTASSGADGLAKAKSERPDLIIADLVMPAMTGWNLANHLRKDSSLPRVPIILLSGMIGADSPPERNELGDFCMAKPVDPPRLLAKIKELLATPS